MMFVPLWVTILPALVLLSPAPAGAPPVVGEPAPVLVLETMIQTPADASPRWIRPDGQAVVVEFWATWCPPCVEAIPHLGELSEKLHGESIQFLSITDEEETIVASFLETHAMPGWVGLDPDRSTFAALGVDGLPLTVLIGPLGVVQAITQPRSLTETLAWFLEGQLEKPVIDETDLDGAFDILLTWDVQRPESIPAAVRQQLGLELRPARRSVNVLLVGKSR